MLYSNPEQLCFPPVAGHTVRADFEGGALSPDFGAQNEHSCHSRQSSVFPLSGCAINLRILLANPRY